MSEIVGNRVKQLRTERGWSVRRFAEECKAKGWTITAAQIENIEGVRRKGRSGRREISVDEWLVLGLALNVSPLVLLLTDRPGDQFALTPETSEQAERVFEWLMGYSGTELSGGAGGPDDVDLEKAQAFSAAFPAWMRATLTRVVEFEGARSELDQALRDAMANFVEQQQKGDASGEDQEG